MMRKFKIYSSKIEYEDTEEDKTVKNYTLDHTVISYLMDQNSNYLTHLGSSLNANDLSEKIYESIIND